MNDDVGTGAAGEADAIHDAPSLYEIWRFDV
jgi:hypothetical protein